jgi:hypothetical protein
MIFLVMYIFGHLNMFPSELAVFNMTSNVQKLFLYLNQQIAEDSCSGPTHPTHTV